jgi:hypothetical protein
MTDVHYSGPIFDGRAEADLSRMTTAIKDAISQEGTDLIHVWLGMHLKHPTGYYESQIVTDTSQSDYVINDSGVVYGPWLEGIGSRNVTTRFKGYKTFRTVTQDLNDNLAEPIAQEICDKYVAEMNL